MRIVVRAEEPADYPDVRAVNEQAFGGRVEARIVDALRSSEGSLSLVALTDGRVAGHILFTPVTIVPSGGEVRVAGLAPMAVRPEVQRQGIGSALIGEGLARCRRLGYQAVVVVGHPEYYPRFGFAPAKTKGLEYEHPVAPEAFMVLELEPEALKGLSGVVKYGHEFSVDS